MKVNEFVLRQAYFICRTEDEIGEDNLKALDIPEDVISKIEKMDRENEQ